MLTAPIEKQARKVMLIKAAIILAAAVYWPPLTISSVIGKLCEEIYHQLAVFADWILRLHSRELAKLEEMRRENN